MARLMAIDYGTKRTGIAVTDSSQIIATALTSVKSADLISFLKQYFSKEKVETVIVGMPKTLNNLPSENAKHVQAFVNTFKKQFESIKIETIDERFTSAIAINSLIDAGHKKSVKQQKGIIDEISATIMLQDYLEKLKNNR
jgi:putative Holliday junction resolvase